MEPSASARRPCEFQLANWAFEEQPPAAGLPLEYASIDIQQQLLEYYSTYSTSAASQHNNNNNPTSEVVVDMEISGREANDIVDSTSTSRSYDLVFEEVNRSFKADLDLRRDKMHRYPEILRRVDDAYKVPTVVAIGPYHRHRPHLQGAEKAKHVAAIHCFNASSLSAEELYGAVVSAADDAHHLYDKDVVGIVPDDDYRTMMFLDACFLVQYMRVEMVEPQDDSLYDFIHHRELDIFRDVMLLENQIPWHVVDTVIRSIPDLSSTTQGFVHSMSYCMLPSDFNRKNMDKDFEWDDSYRPPHLLALLRLYIVGKYSKKDDKRLHLLDLLLGYIVAILRYIVAILRYVVGILTLRRRSEEETNDKIVFSMNAIKLEKIGIKLEKNDSMNLIDMYVDTKETGGGFRRPTLSLAALSLDNYTASYLVSMAAYEVCMRADGNTMEDFAVCSYVRLLGMLVCREEDVHQLRDKDLLQGGGGLNNKEALKFFSSLQALPEGQCYMKTMRGIEFHLEETPWKPWFWELWHDYGTISCTILVTTVTLIGTLVGIVVPFMSSKK